MRAVIADGQGGYSVKNVNVPEPKEEEIIVEVLYVACNPTDWKHAKFIAKDGFILGCDFAGTIKSLGPKVDSTKYALGDRVAGFVMGAEFEGIGAFAEYVRTFANLVWKIPDTTSYEEAAAIGGIGVQTAAMALHQRLKIPHPGSSSQVKDKAVLIWAGSTSVGMYAIQLAKASGLKVITTASPKNFDLLKSLGADACFDYRDPNVTSEIKKWAGKGGITLGVDCFSEGDSFVKSSESMAEGGELVTLGPMPEGVKLANNVKETLIIVYTAFGWEFTIVGIHLPANARDRTGQAAFLELLPQLVQDGRLKSNPVRRCPGSLEQIHVALNYLAAGKASAQKFVYAVKEEFKPVPEPLS